VLFRSLTKLELVYTAMTNILPFVTNEKATNTAIEDQHPPIFVAGRGAAGASVKLSLDHGHARFTGVLSRQHRRTQDDVGSNPPGHRPGDKVSVLYLADDPRQAAIIDRGIWNWAIPGIILAIAASLLWLTIFLLRGGAPRAKPAEIHDAAAAGPALPTRPSASRALVLDTQKLHGISIQYVALRFDMTTHSQSTIFSMDYTPISLFFVQHFACIAP
jgi:hypothetical protein